MCGDLPKWAQHFDIAITILFIAFLRFEQILGRAKWTTAASTLDLIKLGVQKLRGKETITAPVVKDGEPIAEISKNGNS